MLLEMTIAAQKLRKKASPEDAATVQRNDPA